MKLPRVLTTSVVRGTHQGESHGGVYLVDLESEDFQLVVDWNTCDIDFTGRGSDRGLRGIAFRENEVFIAASDELYVFDRNFNQLRSYRNPYLKHCHEIVICGDHLFLTSTGFDSILVFHLIERAFIWGLHLQKLADAVRAITFDPLTRSGPPLSSSLHINSVLCGARGVAFSGLRDNRIFRFGNDALDVFARIPYGTHNVQLYRKGLLFNDSAHDQISYW